MHTHIHSAQQQIFLMRQMECRLLCSLSRSLAFTTLSLSNICTMSNKLDSLHCRFVEHCDNIQSSSSTNSRPGNSNGKNHFIYYVWFSTDLDSGISAFPSKQIPRKIDLNSISKCVFRFQSATFSHYVVHFKDKFQYAVNWATTAIHLLY